MYRRPLFVLFDEVYSLGERAEAEVVTLSRRAKDDLLLAAALAPLAVSELTALVSPRVAAMDSSHQWGAIYGADAPLWAAEALWDSGEKRGWLLAAGRAGASASPCSGPFWY